MTKNKSTKRALLLSALSLLMCVSMLIGSTFAWFTDSVTSGNNIIKSGNLDMKVSYKPYGAQNTVWTEVDDSTVIFGKDALYEPGYTEAVWLKVENLGSLAFRYDLAIDVASEKQGTNMAGEKFSLSDYLEVKYMTTTSTDMESNYYTTRESLDSFNFGGVLNSGVASLSDDIAVIKNGVAFSASDAANGAYSSAYVLVVISMPTTVGNEANHNGTDIPEINFSLTALATQLTYESDSFGSDYDKDAEFDKSIKVTSEAGLLAAIADASTDAANPTVINIANSFETSERITIPAGKYVEINGAGNTISRADDATYVVSAGSVGGNSVFRVEGTASIKDLTIDAKGDDTHRLRGVVVLGTANLTNCTITGAYAPNNWGGALYSGGTINVDNCTLSGNTAKAGAAAIADGGTVNITNTTISGNTITEGGTVYGGSAITISNSTITDDRALYFVGSACIYTVSGDVAIKNIYDAHHNVDSYFGANPLPAISVTSALEKDLVFYVNEPGALIVRRTLLEGADGYTLTDADLAHVKVYFKDNVTTEFTEYDASNATYELVVQDNRIEFVQK